MLFKALTFKSVRQRSNAASSACVFLFLQSKAFEKTANQVKVTKRRENNKMRRLFIAVGVVATLVIVGLIIFGIIISIGQ